MAFLVAKQATLRRTYGLRHARKALELVDSLKGGLEVAAGDPGLVIRLHTINDWLQQRLIGLTAELSQTFFALEQPARAPVVVTNSQSQTQSQSPS